VALLARGLEWNTLVRWNPSMKNKILLASLCLVVVGLSSSCRGMRIRENDEQIEKLESRVSALEGKVEMLSRK